MSRFCCFVLLSLVVADICVAPNPPPIPVGTTPPPPKQDWNDVLTCIDTTAKQCAATCGVTNPHFQRLLACRATFNEISRKAVQSCIVGTTTDKCVKYSQNINDAQLSASVTEPLFRATWSCLNNNCGSPDTCTNICPPTTNKTQASVDKFDSCYEAKVKLTKAEMKKCFEDEVSVTIKEVKSSLPKATKP